MKQERETYTVAETAKILGIGKQLAYEQVKNGRIPAIKCGHRYLIPRAAFLKMLSNPEPIDRLHALR